MPGFSCIEGFYTPTCNTKKDMPRIFFDDISRLQAEANFLTAKEKRSDTFKALMIALMAALVLRQFVLASYNVPHRVYERHHYGGRFYVRQ